MDKIVFNHSIIYFTFYICLFFSLTVDPSDLYIVEPLKFSPEKKVILCFLSSVLVCYVDVDEEIGESFTITFTGP